MIRKNFYVILARPSYILFEISSLFRAVFPFYFMFVEENGTCFFSLMRLLQRGAEGEKGENLHPFILLFLSGHTQALADLIVC